MKLEQLSGGPCDYPGCRGGTCPTVYLADTGDLVVQGYKLDHRDLDQVQIPDGEDVVRIPAAILRDAARAVEERGL